MEYPTLLIFHVHAQVVLMSQRLAAQTRLRVLYASSLPESSKNFLHRLIPSGQCLPIRGWLGICQMDMKVERMVEERRVSFCLKSRTEEVGNGG